MDKNLLKNNLTKNIPFQPNATLEKGRSETYNRVREIRTRVPSLKTSGQIPHPAGLDLTKTPNKIKNLIQNEGEKNPQKMAMFLAPHLGGFQTMPLILNPVQLAQLQANPQVLAFSPEEQAAYQQALETSYVHQALLLVAGNNGLANLPGLAGLPGLAVPYQDLMKAAQIAMAHSSGGQLAVQVATKSGSQVMLNSMNKTQSESLDLQKVVYDERCKQSSVPPRKDAKLIVREPDKPSDAVNLHFSKSLTTNHQSQSITDFSTMISALSPIRFGIQTLPPGLTQYVTTSTKVQSLESANPNYAPMPKNIISRGGTLYTPAVNSVNSESIEIGGTVYATLPVLASGIDLYAQQQQQNFKSLDQKIVQQMPIADLQRRLLTTIKPEDQIVVKPIMVKSDKVYDRTSASAQLPVASAAAAVYNFQYNKALTNERQLKLATANEMPLLITSANDMQYSRLSINEIQEKLEPSYGTKKKKVPTATLR